MAPKKTTSSDSEKSAELQGIEEEPQAMEAERQKKEEEMKSLLAEQEELRAMLAMVEEEEEEDMEEGELASTTGGSVTASDVTSVPASEPQASQTSSHPTSELPSEPANIEPPQEPEASVELPPEGQTSPILSKGPPKLEKPLPMPMNFGMSVMDSKLAPFSNKLFGNLYKERETKFYIVKSANRENLEMAFDHNIWVTTPLNEIRWNEAFMAHTNVLLVFSVQASGAFQGLARLASRSGEKMPADVTWTIPPNLTAKSLAAVFQIDWISRQEVPFDKVSHLRNTWNRNKLVKVARDGQEINWRTGCYLCILFPLDGSCPYDQLLGKIRGKRTIIGPKQAVTASSRSAKRKKKRRKSIRTIIGLRPSGYKRMLHGGPEAKRQKLNEESATGANVIPLSDVVLTY